MTRGYLEGRRSVGKPRGRWEDAFRREDLELLQIWNWKAAAGRTKGWRKEIGEAMARERAKTPQEDEEQEKPSLASASNISCS